MKACIVDDQKKLKDCHRVRYEVFTREQGIPDEVDIDEYDVVDLQKSCHVVIYDNGKPVATGRLKYKDRDTVQLNRIAVLKEYRGRGLGEKVVAALEEFARRQGYKQVYLESQRQAMNFYLKRGYEDLGGELVIAGIPHVKMLKKI